MLDLIKINILLESSQVDLSAEHSALAYVAVQAEPKLDLMLSCNERAPT